jgi:hypothetical protein
MSNIKTSITKKSVFQKIDDCMENFWGKLLPGESRGFTASIILAIGVTLVINSWGIWVSVGGGIVLIIGWLVASFKDEVFWSRSGIAAGLPTLVYGIRNVYPTWQATGIFLIIVAAAMIILGIILFIRHSIRMSK